MYLQRDGSPSAPILLGKAFGEAQPCGRMQGSFGALNGAVKALQFYNKKQALTNNLPNLATDVRIIPAVQFLLRRAVLTTAEQNMKCVPLDVPCLAALMR